MSSAERLWSLRETANFLGVPVKTMYQMNWKGTGPRSFRVGRYRQYAEGDVRAWLESRASTTRSGE